MHGTPGGYLESGVLRGDNGLSRRLAREAALRVLFQVEVGHADIDDALHYNAVELGLDESGRAFAATLSRGALQHRQDLDSLVEQLAVDWRVDRMPYVDRNILRMAAYELLHRNETPPSVAVNEAVELAKMYGDTNSGRFINGVLGNLLRQRAQVPEGTET